MMGCSRYTGCTEILLGWFYIIRLMVNIFWLTVQPLRIHFLKQTTKNCPLTGGGIICIRKVQSFFPTSNFFECQEHTLDQLLALPLFNVLYKNPIWCLPIKKCYNLAVHVNPVWDSRSVQDNIGILFYILTSGCMVSEHLELFRSQCLLVCTT